MPWDCTVVRAEVTNARRPEAYYLHPNWVEFKVAEVQRLPAYDRRNPTKYGDFMYHGRDWTPGQKYYDAAWWNTRKWTEVSNKIPRFHPSGLDNGYNVKYHIKMQAGTQDHLGAFDGEKGQNKAARPVARVGRQAANGGRVRNRT